MGQNQDGASAFFAYARFFPNLKISTFGCRYLGNGARGALTPEFEKCLEFVFTAWYISPGEREQRRARFHSTPEGPIDRGTIGQALLAKNPILPYGQKNLRAFFSRFYLGSRYQIDTKVGGL